MSRDELGEMELLDSLAVELADAGRLARVGVGRGGRPESGFALRLRAELLQEAAAPGIRANRAPLPPARPVDAAGPFIERRAASRPFTGARRSWANETEIPGVDPVSVAIPAVADSMSVSRTWAAWSGTPDALTHQAPFDCRVPGGTVEVVAEAGRGTPLKPSVRWHLPSALPAGWIAVGLAASLIVATLLYGGGMFWSARTVATANEAVAATLVRGGTSSALVSGTELREGDEIKVAASGSATLQLGGSYARLAGGADLRLTSLDPNHIALDQIAGRVYDRVAIPPGGDYTVTTATVTWTAHRTAFDLNRSATSGGDEQVRGLALYDGLDVAGPGLEDNLAEGTSATVVLRPDGAPQGSPMIEPITARTLGDAWLIGNAGIDAALGLPLGQLASLLSPEPTASPTSEPTETATGQQTARPTPGSTPVPTPTATPVPVPKATPRPTPAGPASLGQLSIAHNSDGSYSFSWPIYAGRGFQYYKLVYANWGTTPNYPSSPYWACNDTATTNSWSGTIAAGDYAVRVQVVDDTVGSPVIRAQTNIVHLVVAAAASLPPTQSLGPLFANQTVDGWTFSWTAYTGGSFSYYKLVYEPVSSGKTPSYPDGSSYWAVPGTGDTSAGPIAIPPGDYRVRIQAIGYPSGCAYAYAETTVITIHVSAATPTPSPSSSTSASPSPSASPTA